MKGLADTDDDSCSVSSSFSLSSLANSEPADRKGGSSSDTHLIVYIRTKIVRRLRQIKTLHQYNETMEETVRQQQYRVQELYDLNTALRVKLRGLLATSQCLSQQGIRTRHYQSFVPPSELRETLPDLLNLDGATAYSPGSSLQAILQSVIKPKQDGSDNVLISPEEQATLLVDRLNKLDIIAEKTQAWKTTLQAKNEDLLRCTEQLECAQLEMERSIDSLEASIQNAMEKEMHNTDSCSVSSDGTPPPMPCITFDLSKKEKGLSQSCGLDDTHDDGTTLSSHTHSPQPERPSLTRDVMSSFRKSSLGRSFSLKRLGISFAHKK